MAKNTRAKRRKDDRVVACINSLIILAPILVLGCVLVAAMTPVAWQLVGSLATLARWREGPGAIGPSAPGPGSLAPVFTREVRHWGGDIDRWAAAHGLDSNLVAVVIQIESCGHPSVISPAGARGLFQVMPYHFAEGEDPFNPETNAARGLGVFADCLDRAGGDFGRAMVCYNGGPLALEQTYDEWPQEVRDYYTWATGIYADLQSGAAQSDTVARWLAAGGASLCRRAAAALGLE
ncbi:MAG: transglycosylase SLT domain-containing protein [Anaerolineae bacterium]|nr:transglycosylase SLT domain-containing protein [Anaerolineae bacterium]